MFGLSCELTEEKVTALLKLAEFKQCDGIFTLVNEYFPDAYPESIRKNPWFLVKVPQGLIKIGPRKRVIEISWTDTALRKMPPNLTKPEGENESITKDMACVHCWDMEQLSKRLWWLRVELENLNNTKALELDSVLPKHFQELIMKLTVNAKALRHPLSGEQLGVGISSELFREVTALHDLIYDIKKGRAACPT